jgi:hypothetical protein
MLYASRLRALMHHVSPTRRRPATARCWTDPGRQCDSAEEGAWPLRGGPLRRQSHTAPGRPTYAKLGPGRAAAGGYTRVEPFGGPWLPYGRTRLWRPGWQRASSGSGEGLSARARARGTTTGSGVSGWSHPLSPCPTLEDQGCMQPRSLEVVVSSPASYSRAAGPVGQTAGRATSGARALVAPGALLNPASEANGRGARPKEIRGAQWGADESGKGRAATKAHAGKAGPAWWMSRGGSLRRDRVAGEPLGPGMRNPGSLARMGAMGSHPSRGPGGASRIACTPPGSKRVPPAVRPPPRGLPGSRMRPGSPGAGLPYLSTCGLVVYGQGGARESRAWSHV